MFKQRPEECKGTSQVKWGWREEICRKKGWHMQRPWDRKVPGQKKLKLEYGSQNISGAETVILTELLTH